MLFRSNDTATTEIYTIAYTLSLHDALPISRIRFAFVSTIGLSFAGIIYAEVFSAELLPLIDKDGIFSTPVVWLDNLAPIVIVTLLLAIWIWVIAGAVQDERTVDRRRVRR